MSSSLSPEKAVPAFELTDARDFPPLAALASDWQEHLAVEQSVVVRKSIERAASRKL